MSPLDLVALLRCPRCAGALAFVGTDDGTNARIGDVQCGACGAAYPVLAAERAGAGPIIDLLSPRATSAHEAAHGDGERRDEGGRSEGERDRSDDGRGCD